MHLTQDFYYSGDISQTRLSEILVFEETSKRIAVKLLQFKKVWAMCLRPERVFLAVLFDVD